MEPAVNILDLVLLAAGVMSGTCLALAAMLLLAERYLVRYGPCEIDINRGARRLRVEGGSSLLASLMSQGVFIPSACGGRGTCAYCKVKVVEGGGPVAPTEEPLLSSRDRQTGLRISCQVKVRRNMAIEVPDELLSVRQYRAVVERMRDLTHNIRELRLRLADSQTIEFVPGQYIQLETPAYGNVPEPVYRAYSISSPPSDNRHVELIIRLVPGGICTTWVFTILKEGDEVRFNGPYGRFRLSDQQREMIWVAGGSGMAPFWSMVRYMKEAGIARPCTYFFGALRPQDLLLADEFRRLERELPWLKFVPAVSAPAQNDVWQGERGLITEVVDRHLTDGTDKEAYLCGSSGMIEAAIKVLKAKGVPEQRIYYDKFD